MAASRSTACAALGCNSRFAFVIETPQQSNDTPTFTAPGDRGGRPRRLSISPHHGPPVVHRTWKPCAVRRIAPAPGRLRHGFHLHRPSLIRAGVPGLRAFKTSPTTTAAPVVGDSLRVAGFEFYRPSAIRVDRGGCSCTRFLLSLSGLALYNPTVFGGHSFHVLRNAVVYDLPAWPLLNFSGGVQSGARDWSNSHGEFWVICDALGLSLFTESTARPSNSFFGFIFHT